MTPTVVAVDPGASKAGIVARRGDELVDFLLLVRHPDDSLLSWVNQVSSGVAGLYMASWQSGRHAPPVKVACEQAQPPNPHVGRVTNVAPILETAHVVGALMHMFHRELILVPAGGHGDGPLQAYPDALIGSKERKGRGVLRDARQAWDVAGAAATMVKMGVTNASL